MTRAIGIRLPKDMLRQIELLGEEEMEDRSTVIRKLIIVGYKELSQKKASEEYMKGSITLSEAAHKAGLTLWEMERYLVERGFKSGYSVDELEREMKLLEIPQKR